MSRLSTNIAGLRRRASAAGRLAAAAAVVLATSLSLVGAEQERPKSKFNKVLRIGDAAPEWADLPGVDDQRHSLKDFAEARAVVVVFTCNHCPVARAYEDRLLDFAATFVERQVQVVAINVNRNAADGLEKMKARAKAKAYPFPYLFDDSQQSARDYGAMVTPHFFVLDAERRIAYMGAFDNGVLRQEPADRHYLIDAVEAVLGGKAPPVAESLQRGCPIEFE